MACSESAISDILRDMRKNNKELIHASKSPTAAEISEMIECTLCNDFLVQPKMLPCGHSFCLGCLRKWAKVGEGRLRNAISCPMDRSEFLLPRSGVDGLPTNRIVADLGMLHAERKGDSGAAAFEEELSLGRQACDECRNEADVYACCHCRLRVCDSCRSLHRDEARTRLRRCSARLRTAMALQQPEPNITTEAAAEEEEEEEDLKVKVNAFKDDLLRRITSLIDEKHEQILANGARSKRDYTSRIEAFLRVAEEADAEINAICNETDFTPNMSTLDDIDKRVDALTARMSTAKKRRRPRMTFTPPDARLIDEVLKGVAVLYAGELISLADESPAHEASPAINASGFEARADTDQEASSQDPEVEFGDFQTSADTEVVTAGQRGTGGSMDSIAAPAEERSTVARRSSSPRLDQNWSTLGRGHGTKIDHFSDPTSVAVSPVTGNIYVVDSSNNRIQYFSRDGEFLGDFGREGSALGEYRNPIAAAFGKDGDLVIVDCGNDRVQVVTSEGDAVYCWGSRGTGPHCLHHPTGVAVEPLSGNIFVADRNNKRVQVYSSDGQFLRTFGSASPMDRHPGWFDYVWDLSIDGGLVAVSEHDMWKKIHRVRIYNLEGQHVDTLQGSLVKYPRGVRLHKSGKELLVCCEGGVLVYQLSPVVQLKKRIPSEVKKPCMIEVWPPNQALVTLHGDHLVHKISIDV